MAVGTVSWWVRPRERLGDSKGGPTSRAFNALVCSMVTIASFVTMVVRQLTRLSSI